jgi:hypothetical protein
LQAGRQKDNEQAKIILSSVGAKRVVYATDHIGGALRFAEA